MLEDLIETCTRRTFLTVASLGVLGTAMPASVFATSAGPFVVSSAEVGRLPDPGAQQLVLDGDRLTRMTVLCAMLRTQRPQRLAIRLDGTDQVLLDVALDRCSVTAMPSAGVWGEVLTLNYANCDARGA